MLEYAPKTHLSAPETVLGANLSSVGGCASIMPNYSVIGAESSKEFPWLLST